MSAVAAVSGRSYVGSHTMETAVCTVQSTKQGILQVMMCSVNSRVVSLVVLVVGSLASGCASGAGDEFVPEQNEAKVASPVVPGCCSGDALDPGTDGIRLTTSFQKSVADFVGAMLYARPLSSWSIALFDGASWNLREADSGTSFYGVGLADGDYDVFAYWDGAHVQLEPKLVGGTISERNGVAVSGADSTRRYLGTVGVQGGQFWDTPNRRWVWNLNNQVERVISVATNSTTSWYLPGNNVWREVPAANGAISVVVGGKAYGDVVGTSVTVHAASSCVVNTPANAVAFFDVGVGVDAYNVPNGQANVSGSVGNTAFGASYAFWEGTLDRGRYNLRWLEVGYTGVTFFCYASATNPPFGRTGMAGTVVM